MSDITWKNRDEPGQDGWVDIMYHGLDAVGVDMQVITLFKHFLQFFLHFSTTFQVFSRHFVDLANGNFESDQQNNT